MARVAPYIYPTFLRQKNNKDFFVEYSGNQNSFITSLQQISRRLSNPNSTIPNASQLQQQLAKYLEAIETVMAEKAPIEEKYKEAAIKLSGFKDWLESENGGTKVVNTLYELSPNGDDFDLGLAHLDILTGIGLNNSGAVQARIENARNLEEYDYEDGYVKKFSGSYSPNSARLDLPPEQVVQEPEQPAEEKPAEEQPAEEKLNEEKPAEEKPAQEQLQQEPQAMANQQPLERVAPYNFDAFKSQRLNDQNSVEYRGGDDDHFIASLSRLSAALSNNPVNIENAAQLQKELAEYQQAIETVTSELLPSQEQYEKAAEKLSSFRAWLEQKNGNATIIEKLHALTNTIQDSETNANNFDLGLAYLDVLTGIGLNESEAARTYIDAAKNLTQKEFDVELGYIIDVKNFTGTYLNNPSRMNLPQEQLRQEAQVEMQPEENVAAGRQNVAPQQPPQENVAQGQPVGEAQPKPVEAKEPVMQPPQANVVEEKHAEEKPVVEPVEAQAVANQQPLERVAPYNYDAFKSQRSNNRNSVEYRGGDNDHFIASLSRLSAALSKNPVNIENAAQLQKELAEYQQAIETVTSEQLPSKEQYEKAAEKLSSFRAWLEQKNGNATIIEKLHALTNTIQDSVTNANNFDLGLAYLDVLTGIGLNKSNAARTYIDAAKNLTQKEFDVELGYNIDVKNFTGTYLNNPSRMNLPQEQLQQEAQVEKQPEENVAAERQNVAPKQPPQENVAQGQPVGEAQPKPVEAKEPVEPAQRPVEPAQRPVGGAQPQPEPRVLTVAEQLQQAARNAEEAALAAMDEKNIIDKTKVDNAIIDTYISVLRKAMADGHENDVNNHFRKQLGATEEYNNFKQLIYDLVLPAMNQTMVVNNELIRDISDKLNKSEYPMNGKYPEIMPYTKNKQVCDYLAQEVRADQLSADLSILSMMDQNNKNVFLKNEISDRINTVNQSLSDLRKEQSESDISKIFKRTQIGDNNVLEYIKFDPNEVIATSDNLQTYYTAKGAFLQEAKDLLKGLSEITGDPNTHSKELQNMYAKLETLSNQSLTTSTSEMFKALTDLAKASKDYHTEMSTRLHFNAFGMKSGGQKRLDFSGKISAFCQKFSDGVEDPNVNPFKSTGGLHDTTIIHNNPLPEENGWFSQSAQGLTEFSAEWRRIQEQIFDLSDTLASTLQKNNNNIVVLEGRSNEFKNMFNAATELAYTTFPLNQMISKVNELKTAAETYYNKHSSSMHVGAGQKRLDVSESLKNLDTTVLQQKFDQMNAYGLFNQDESLDNAADDFREFTNTLKNREPYSFNLTMKKSALEDAKDNFLFHLNIQGSAPNANPSQASEALKRSNRINREFQIMNRKRNGESINDIKALQFPERAWRYYTKRRDARELFMNNVQKYREEYEKYAKLEENIRLAKNILPAQIDQNTVKKINQEKELNKLIENTKKSEAETQKRISEIKDEVKKQAEIEKAENNFYKIQSEINKRQADIIQLTNQINKDMEFVKKYEKENMPEPPSRDLIDTDFSEKLPPNLSKIEELIDKYGTQVRKLQNDLPIMDGNIINYDELTEEQKKAFKDNLEAAIDIGFELRKTALSQTMTPEELAAEQKMKEVTKDNFKNHFDTMVRSVDADTMRYLLMSDFDALGLIKETSKEFYGNTKVSDYFDKYKNEKVVIQDGNKLKFNEEVYNSFKTSLKAGILNNMAQFKELVQKTNRLKSPEERNEHAEELNKIGNQILKHVANLCGLEKMKEDVEADPSKYQSDSLSDLMRDFIKKDNGEVTQYRQGYASRIETSETFNKLLVTRYYENESPFNLLSSIANDAISDDIYDYGKYYDENVTEKNLYLTPADHSIRLKFKIGKDNKMTSKYTQVETAEKTIAKELDKKESGGFLNRLFSFFKKDDPNKRINAVLNNQEDKLKDAQVNIFDLAKKFENYKSFADIEKDGKGLEYENCIREMLDNKSKLYSVKYEKKLMEVNPDEPHFNRKGGFKPEEFKDSIHQIIEVLPPEKMIQHCKDGSIFDQIKIMSGKTFSKKLGQDVIDPSEKSLKSMKPEERNKKLELTREILVGRLGLLKAKLQKFSANEALKKQEKPEYEKVVKEAVKHLATLSFLSHRKKKINKNGTDELAGLPDSLTIAINGGITSQQEQKGDDVLSTAYRQNPGASNIMMRKNDFITMIQTNKLEELIDLAINEKTIHPVKGSDFINARKDGGKLFKQQWQKDHPVDKAPVFSSESELEMKGVKFKLVQDSDLNQLKNDVVKKEKDERAFIEKNQERINKEQNDKDMVNDVMANDMFLNNL